MSSNRRRIAAQKKSNNPALRENEDRDFVAVAKIRRPHGLKGEVLLEILTDFPERITPEGDFFLGNDYQVENIISLRPHSNGMLATFENYSSREDWDRLRNQYLYSKVEDLPKLEDGDFYHHELIGLKIEDQDGKDWGKIVEIIETGANDVYVIRDENEAEVLIPATSEVIIDIDLAKALVRIQNISGLLPE